MPKIENRTAFEKEPGVAELLVNVNANKNCLQTGERICCDVVHGDELNDRVTACRFAFKDGEDLTVKCYAVKGDEHRDLGVLTFRNHELIDPPESFASSVSNVSSAKNIYRRWCALSDGGEVLVQWMVNTFRRSPGQDYPQAKLDRRLKNQPIFDPDPVRVAASQDLRSTNANAKANPEHPTTQERAPRTQKGEATGITTPSQLKSFKRWGKIEIRSASSMASSKQKSNAKRKDVTPGNSPPLKVMKQPPNFETTKAPEMMGSGSSPAFKRAHESPAFKKANEWSAPLSGRSASPRQPEPEGSRSTWWSRTNSPSERSRSQSPSSSPLASPSKEPATFDVKPRSGALSFTNSNDSFFLKMFWMILFTKTNGSR